MSTWTVAVAGRTLEYLQTSRISVKVALYGPVRVARWVQDRVLRRQAMQRDIFAVGFTRYPQALVDALEKIERDPGVVAVATPGTRPSGSSTRPREIATTLGPRHRQRIGRLRALVGT